MIAVVTGTSSGLGAALSKLMLDRGWTVIGASRRSSREAVHHYNVDVSQEQECIDFITDVIDTYGTVDILVNNAGRGNHASIEHTSTQIWRDVFAVNIDSIFWLTREVLPHMRSHEAGHIINIASMAGVMGFPYNAAYVAAKHAVVGFTAALRAELLGTNIQATVVCPAGVISDWGDVTEGGSTNQLYAGAIPRSRVIAREQHLQLAPLFKLMSAEAAAAIIMNAIDVGRSNDIFTHEGSRELAEQAVTDRITLEDRHRALYLAMHEVYHKERNG